MSLNCPSEATLILVAHRVPGEPQFAEIEAHVESCPTCRGLVERLAQERPSLTNAGRLDESSPTTEIHLPRINGFEIDRELGRGSMGVVYLAMPMSGVRRPVALKVMRMIGGASRDPRRQWTREAKSLAQARHPDVVHVYDSGECEGLLYLVLEYVPGGTLQDRIDGPFSPADAAALVEVLARAVASFHGRGVLHLDLKPGNILLEPPGEGESHKLRPRISDFGLARIFDPADGVSDPSRGPGGTPSYMAPEATFERPSQLGVASDIYSLGAILYELLTGRPPFKGADERVTLEMVRSQEAIPPRRLNSRVPRDLEIIALKCLEKRPSHRYLTADALAEDLARWQSGRPILARPASKLEHLRRWAGRNPVAAALALGLMTTIIIAFVALTVLLKEAREGRNQAEANYLVASESLSDAVETCLQVSALMNRSGADAINQFLSKIERQQQRLLEARPGDPETQLRLAQIQLSISAHRIPSHPVREVLNLLDATEPLLAPLVRSEKHATAVQLAYSRLEAMRGEMALSTRRYPEAVSLYKKAIRHLPEIEPKTHALISSQLFFQMGMSLRGIGEHDEARDSFSQCLRALELLPADQADSPMSLNTRVAALSELKEYRTAVEVKRLVQKINPRSAMEVPFLGELLLDVAAQTPAGPARDSLQSEAIKEFKHASDLADRLASSFPGDIALRSRVTSLKRMLASMYIMDGRRDDAASVVMAYFAQEKLLGAQSVIINESMDYFGLLVSLTELTANGEDEHREASPQVLLQMRDRLVSLISKIRPESRILSVTWLNWKIILAQSSRATEARRAGDLERADRILSAMEGFSELVIEQSPADPDAYRARGEAAMHRAKLEWARGNRSEVEKAWIKAVESSRRAVELLPDNPELVGTLLDQERRLRELRASQ